MYQVELVWNREFHFVPYGDPCGTVEEAARLAASVVASGDGARVKKAQVLNAETGAVVVASHEVWRYVK